MLLGGDILITGFMEYGAIYGKVKALYGNRLTPEDFKHMSRLRGVPEIAVFLKTTPGWTSCLKGLDISSMSRGTLENVLHGQYLDEFLRIYKYVKTADKHFMNFPILHLEMEQILAVLRSLQSKHARDMTPPLTPEIKAASKIDFRKFESVTNHQELLAAIEKTVFYRPLTLAIGKDKPIKYMNIELVAQTAYYRELYSQTGTVRNKNVRKILFEYLGEEIDLQNIMRVMRLNVNFPGFTNDIFTCLLPFNYKLKDGIIRKLYACTDINAMLEILKTTYYKKVFSGHTFNRIEDYYGEAVYLKNRNMLNRGFPSIIIAVAYLNLKRIELSNIIHVIESVRYGISPENSETYLTIGTC